MLRIARALPKHRISSAAILVQRRGLLATGPVFNDAKEQRKAQLEHTHNMQRDWDAPILTYEEVKKRSQQPQKGAYLIDVREVDEVKQGSIPSAVNIPLSTLANDLHLSRDDFKAKFGFDKPAHGQEVVFYCRSGKRSASASDVAKRNGYTNIFNYVGSWLDWTAREGTSKTS